MKYTISGRIQLDRFCQPSKSLLAFVNGCSDAVIPITSTRYSIDALHLPTVGPWRAWDDDGQVGGWTQEYEGLTFVTVRGGGHEVPLHKPKQALAIFKSFLAGEQMPSFQQLSNDI
nr:Serine carboxypeptidase II-2 [Ipomoea batatas]